MTDDTFKAALTEELERIAPEIVFDAVDPTTDIREAFEIDSMDFQNLVSALAARFSLPIPEADYDQLGTIDAIIVYLRRETQK